MYKQLKYFTITSGALLLLLALIESNAFKKREKIKWENSSSLSWNNFRGYPNFLSGYAAAVNSYFEIDNINDSSDNIEVSTIMRAHRSWVKKQHISSDYLLRHEQYHFNISELIARRLRKALRHTPKEKLTKENIQKLYYQYIRELGYTQDFYDLETNHSLEIERQFDWEYIVDSMLNDLGIYASNKMNNNIHENGHKYYRKITRNAWHQFEGSYPIDSLLALKTKHYRFYYKDDKISRIESWLRKEPTLDDELNIFSLNFSYNEDIEVHKYCDLNTHETVSSDGIYGQKIEHIKNTMIVINLDKNEMITNNKLGIGKIEWELDHKKRKEIGKIYDSKGNRITDIEGFYTIKYRYDKYDNLIESGNYDGNNKRKPIKNGIAFYKYGYDANQNLISINGYNEKSMLRAFENNVAIADRRFDLNGNITRESIKNAKGKLILNDKHQAISYYTYDEYGNIVIEAYFGLNKNLAISDEKIGCLIRMYDSIGQVIEINNYDAYKQPLNDIEGKCKASYSYNKNDLIDKESHYFADSLLKLNYLKTIKYEYDSSKNITSETWFNEQGELKPDTNGICISKFEYDSNNNVSTVSYFNDSMLLQENSEGIAKYVYKHDGRHNRIEVAYLNEYNKPAIRTNNVSLEAYKYNKQNLIEELKYFDANGNLTAGNNDVQIIRWKYNEQGNTIEESYFKSLGERCIDNNGVAKYTYFYDAKGNNIQINCYNSNNQLMLAGNSGIAIMKHSYNDQNKLTQTAYLDYNNQLKSTPEGIAIEVFKYNDYGYLTRRESYSEFEQPTVSSFGYAAVDIVYDLNFNMAAQILRDENNYLMPDTNGNAIYNWEYNRNGYIINNITYDDSFYNLNRISLGNFSKKIFGLKSGNMFASENDNTRVQTTYFKNGQKRSEVMYVDGKLDGQYITYFETGELEGEINYVKGEREGLMVEYSKNGQKIRELKYENNTYVGGSEKEWYQDGTLRSEYINGNFVGYDPQGNKISN